MTFLDIKFAVIMPAYNAEQTIERAIQSFLAQSFSAKHLYIIDDCSTDATSNILMRYSDFENISIVRNSSNSGVAFSRNAGLLLVKNESHVTFLDSDDQWLPNKLQLQALHLHSSDFLSSAYNFIAKENHKVAFSKQTLNKNEFLMKKFRVCFSSVAFKTSSDVNFNNMGHEDFDFLLQLYDLYGDMIVLPEALVNYFVTEGSVSSDKIRSAKWHYKILKKHFNRNPFKRIFFMICYCFQGVFFTTRVK